MGGAVCNIYQKKSTQLSLRDRKRSECTTRTSAGPVADSHAYTRWPWESQQLEQQTAPRVAPAAAASRPRRAVRPHAPHAETRHLLERRSARTCQGGR